LPTCREPQLRIAVMRFVRFAIGFVVRTPDFELIAKIFFRSKNFKAP
jgi:hypothetical protein